MLQSLFLQWAGEPSVECLAIGGGSASTRRYFRLATPSRSAIGCIATDLRENKAFFTFTRHLRAKGMPVPELYAVSDDCCHYLQQDLGDQTLYSLLFDKKRQGAGFDAEMMQLYRQALTDLDAIQKAGRDADFSYGFPRPAFDSRAMLWDLNYFKYFYLKLSGIPFDEDRLQDDFEHLVGILLQADCSYFMYRDFNPRNIMVVADCTQPAFTHDSARRIPSRDRLTDPPSHQLYYIDYQGARLGAAQYDVASLLYSAKSDLPDAVRLDLLRHYVALHGDPHFLDHFWHYVLMRILQTLGAYGFRGLYEHKPYFVESIPLALNNLRRLLDDHPALLAALPELHRVLVALPRPQSTDAMAQTLTVSVSSFSYKHGLPVDASGNGGGHIFDCRALPNPGRYEQYRNYTGIDRPVIEFLQREPAVAQFLHHACAIVDQSVDKYFERHFTHLSVAFGCTGGQHRSVYCAEQMARHLRQHYPSVVVDLVHRER